CYARAVNYAGGPRCARARSVHPRVIRNAVQIDLPTQRQPGRQLVPVGLAFEDMRFAGGSEEPRAFGEFGVELAAAPAAVAGAVLDRALVVLQQPLDRALVHAEADVGDDFVAVDGEAGVQRGELSIAASAQVAR